MKLLIILALTLSAASGLATNGFKEKNKAQTLLETRWKALDQDKDRLVIQQAILQDQLRFIKKYNNNELDIDDIQALLAEHPIMTNGPAGASLMVIAKLLTDKLINPKLASPGDDILSRIMKRFPKLSQRSAYLVAAAVTGASVFYTIVQVMHYAEFTQLSEEARYERYVEIYDELSLVEKNLDSVRTRLTLVTLELNKFTADNVRDIYNR